MANIEIRVKLAETGVKQYEVAEYLKIAETSFSRKLRNELPTEEKSLILQIINELSTKKETA